MSEAKVPEDTSDWKCIDIFLFSNGQRASPPRKYHLETSQLDWWIATLGYLARAHYGSLESSVELYTIDGKKIETPMQLSNGNAYVAVVPPDYFINASYEKYLIKASRSWEKGQTRRASNTTMDTLVMTDEPQIITERSGSDIKLLEANTTKETRNDSVTLKTIVAGTVDTQRSIIVKPSTTPQVALNKLANNANWAKQPDRRKSLPIQRPAIVKKMCSLTSPPTSRKPSLKTKDSVKINTNTNSERPSMSSNSVKLPIRNKIYKPIQKKRESLPDSMLAKVEEVVTEIKSSSSIKVLNKNHTFMNNNHSEINNIIQDKEVESHWYKNLHSEKPSIAVDPNDLPQTSIDEQSIDIKKQIAVTKLLNSNTEQMGFTKSKNLHDIDRVSNTSVFKTNGYEALSVGNPSLSPPIVSAVMKPEESIAMINKEGVVNLKLNIEIWSGPEDSKSNKYLNILNPEKGSQVEIEDKFKELNSTVQTEDEPSKSNQGIPKVIIVNCTCFNHGVEYNTDNILSASKNNSKCVVILPIWKSEENDQRCECKNEQVNVPIIRSRQNSSFNNPIKKTVSCLSLLKHKLVSHAEISSRANSTELKVETNSLHDKNEVTMVKRKSVAIREDQIVLPDVHQPMQSVQPEVAADPEKSELIVIKRESRIGIMHKTATKSTQTEWCDVLLEARLQDDGHYAFFMPPLETLKIYEL